MLPGDYNLPFEWEQNDIRLGSKTNRTSQIQMDAIQFNNKYNSFSWSHGCSIFCFRLRQTQKSLTGSNKWKKITNSNWFYIYIYKWHTHIYICVLNTNIFVIIADITKYLLCNCFFLSQIVTNYKLFCNKNETFSWELFGLRKVFWINLHEIRG